MNMYELTLILPQNTTAAKKKAVTETIDKIVKMNKGEIKKTEDWGEKQLAYAIAKNTSGTFLHFELELENQSVKALSDKLRMEDGIIRNLLVRKGE